VDLLHIVLRMATIVRLRYCFALRERETERDYTWRMVCINIYASTSTCMYVYVCVDEEALGDGRIFNKMLIIINKSQSILIFITRKYSLIIKFFLANYSLIMI
jgi:hypothetical protein